MHIRKEIQVDVDTGYLGITQFHPNSVLPRKKSKHHPLSAEDKLFNQSVSSQRVTNDHVIGMVKRFKILASKYRNRRKRFALRFNLLAGLCNFDLMA